MWDRDVLSANDIIAETHIDLYRWFLKASSVDSETCNVESGGAVVLMCGSNPSWNPCPHPPLLHSPAKLFSLYHSATQAAESHSAGSLIFLPENYSQ